MALVIGNSSYVSTTPLDNPKNDAADIAAALERLGFEVVLGLDLGFDGMRQARKRFNNLLKSADVAMFFYAGHALQVDGVNYLAPVDTLLQEKNDLEFETVSLDLILRQMERNTETNLVFLDACRDNPLIKQFESVGRSTGAGTGLAQPNISQGGPFIAFATSPGDIALDGTGRNSPFTTSLLRHIERPSVELNTMMIDVRAGVYKATGRQQRPWTNSGLLGRFFFNKVAALPESEPQEEPAATPPISASRQKEIWGLIKDTKEPKILLDFIKKFPDGETTKLAAIRLEQLLLGGGDTQPDPGTAAKPDTQTPAAKQSEREIALIVENAEPEKPQVMTREVIRTIQTELNRVGCNAGAADGQWGPKGRKSLASFSENSGLKYASTEPTFDLLDDLKTQTGRVCPLVCGVRYRVSGDKCVRKTCASGLVLTSKGSCVKKTTTVSKTAPKTAPKSNCFKFNGRLVCE
ncbi:MAG: hypothetical protein GY952_10105 [Rhodobacteraceae bacterium]|nr:hypothetical protein [Paracoccaceae bacterium]